MEALKMMNLFSAMLSEEELVSLLEKSINDWKEDPIPKNFSLISMNTMMITLKDRQRVKGDNNSLNGLKEVNKDLDKIENITKMMTRMDGDHIDTSKN